MTPPLWNFSKNSSVLGEVGIPKPIPYLWYNILWYRGNPLPHPSLAWTPSHTWAQPARLEPSPQAHSFCFFLSQHARVFTLASGVSGVCLYTDGSVCARLWVRGVIDRVSRLPVSWACIIIYGRGSTNRLKHCSQPGEVSKLPCRLKKGT